jgi:ankyrin repeat protein
VSSMSSSTSSMVSSMVSSSVLPLALEDSMLLEPEKDCIARAVATGDRAVDTLYGRFEVVQRLLRCGSSPSLYHGATSQDSADVDAAQQLSSRESANVNEADSHGATPRIAANLHVSAGAVMPQASSAASAPLLPASQSELASGRGGLEEVRLSSSLEKDGVNVAACTFLPSKQAGREDTELPLPLEADPGPRCGTTNGFTPLHEASRNGDLDTVLALIEAGADMEQKTAAGYTPLHFAAENNHAEVCCALIDIGEPNLQEVNAEGATALHLAARKSNFETVQVLLEAGADVEVTDHSGATPLLAACEVEELLHGDVIGILLELGSNVNKARGDGSAALHLIAEAANASPFGDGVGCGGLVRDLVAGGAVVDVINAVGSTPLILAACNGHVEAMHALLDAGADVNKSDCAGTTALHYAGANGHIEVVDALTKAGADINFRDKAGRTPLMHASLNSRVAAQQSLLQAGADVMMAEVNGNTPLHIGSRLGHCGVVRILLHYKANVNEANCYGSTSLHFAADSGHLNVTKYLLQAGANVQQSDCYNVAPLHMAARRGYTGIAEALFLAGAECNSRDKENCTPLHVAARNGNADVVKVLLDFGAAKDAVDMTGCTALFLGAQGGHIDTVKQLLVAGVDKETPLLASSFEGSTPLVVAAFQGHGAIVRELILAGAHQNARGGGKTALEWAQEKGHDDVVKILA